MRREKAKVAEEERLEARAVEKERRKREEATKLARLQEEAAEKAMEQQRKLLEMQDELGRKASEAHRVEVEKTRRKDKVISSLSVHQSGEDVEEFLLAQERKLGVGGIPEDEWLTLIAPKLTGGLGTSWQELCDEGLDYWAVRTAWLKGCGYTPSLAGEAYYTFRHEQLEGMAGEQVFKKGAQLLKRMVAPTVLDKAVIFKIVKPWVYTCVGRRARAVLEAREIEDAEALARGLQDYLSTEGDRVPGKSAVFSVEKVGSQRPTYGVGSGTEFRKEGALGNGSGSLRCFVCGKMGHKAVDCWHKEKGVPGARAAESERKIVCYICGVEGHKATTCPEKKEAQKGANVKQINHIKMEKGEETIVQGRVNGRRANLMLDSGAQITIVPEEMVDRKLRTKEVVTLRGFQSGSTITVPTAKVKLEVNGIGSWEETVALAPAEEGKRTDVIYGLRLKSQRGLNLVKLVSSREETEHSEHKNGARVVERELKVTRVTAEVPNSVRLADRESKLREETELRWKELKRYEERELKIARVTVVVPKAIEQEKRNEKKMVKIVKKENKGTSDTASRKTARILAPNSRNVAVSGKQNNGDIFRQKKLLKPVKASDVVLRASVIEQARQKRAKARLETSRRERKMKWEKDSSQSETSRRLGQNVVGERNIMLDCLGAKAEEEKMEDFGFVLDGLGERAEDDRVKKKEEFVDGSKEVKKNKGEKNCDFVSTGFSSLSSGPTTSVVCCAADGLGTFTRKKVSYRDVLLSTLPTHSRDSRIGDPKRDGEGGLRKRFGNPRQLDAGREEREKTSCGAEATENDLEERIEEDELELRAAPSLFVGGDVGSESPQKEGVATDGVALQN